MSVAAQDSATAVVEAPPAVSRAPASPLAFAGRLYRSAAQVVLFGVFGAGGAAMTLLAWPLLALVPGRPRRVGAARRLIGALLRRYIGTMQRLRLIEVRWHGREHLGLPGTLVVANHPTLIDAFLLIGAVDTLVPVAKRALLANPFTLGAVHAADYVINDDGPALLDSCDARLAAGQALLLFPEGTRTPVDGQVRLRRGAAQLAVRSACPVVPVRIDVTERFLTRAHRWWLAPSARPRVTITATAPVDPAPFTAAAANPSLAARRLNEYLQQCLAKEPESRGPI